MLSQNVVPSINPKNLIDRIHDKVKSLCLDFSIQETPYSSYITIRKKFQKNLSNEDIKVTIKKEITIDENYDSQEKIEDQERVNAELKYEITKLKEELQMKNNDIDTIKKEYEDLKVEAKENNKVKSGFEEEIKQIEDEKYQLKKELITVKQNYKKDVNDLKKKHNTDVEKYEKEVEILTEFKNRKINEERERKKIEKKERKKAKKLNNLSDNKICENKADDKDVSEGNEYARENESSSSEKVYVSLNDESNTTSKSPEIISHPDSENFSILNRNGSTFPKPKSFASANQFGIESRTSSSSSVPSLIHSFEASANASSVSSRFSDKTKFDYGFEFPRASPQIDWDTWPYG